MREARISRMNAESFTPIELWEHKVRIEKYRASRARKVFI